MAIAAGAANLLVIGLERGRQVGVENKAHIRLVDPHAKGNGGADDDTLLGHEQVLRLGAILRLHPSVIGNGAMAL